MNQQSRNLTMLLDDRAQPGAFSSTTETTSSRHASTTISLRKASKSSALQSARQRRRGWRSAECEDRADRMSPLPIDQRREAPRQSASQFHRSLQSSEAAPTLHLNIPEPKRPPIVPRPSGRVSRRDRLGGFDSTSTSGRREQVQYLFRIPQPVPSANR
jgi:hypothetical protein